MSEGKVIQGDCLEVLRGMEDNSVDAVVCDPPYGLSNTTPAQVADTIAKWAGGDRDHVPTGRGFMGKSWDAFVPPPAVWDECLRVLKPGGHMVVFAGSRTHDLMGLSIRLAGFEMRDSLAWLYGSGFPKSHDVGKAIDKLAGAEREVIGRKGGRYAYRHNPETASHAPNGMFRWGDRHYAWADLPPNAREFFTKAAAEKGNITAPATPEAAQWDGWGTALKPAFEPIVLARKPLAEKTVARNVLAYGTGAINVDGCRIETDDNLNGGGASGGPGGTFLLHGAGSVDELRALADAGAKTPDGRDAKATLARALTSKERGRGEYVQPSGRWPANVLLDHHAAAWVDEQSGDIKGRVGMKAKTAVQFGVGRERIAQSFDAGTEDSGGASRFFYTAKAPKRERPNVNGVQHPTVKPLAIMRWLIRLVTPPGGVVLDPFAGSGATIEAALIEGFSPIGIEMETDYLPLIQHRIDRQAGTLPA